MPGKLLFITPFLNLSLCGSIDIKTKDEDLYQIHHTTHRFL